MQFFIEFKIAFKIFNQRKKKLYNFHFDPVSPSLPQRIFLEMQKKNTSWYSSTFISFYSFISQCDTGGAWILNQSALSLVWRACSYSILRVHFLCCSSESFQGWESSPDLLLADLTGHIESRTWIRWDWMNFSFSSGLSRLSAWRKSWQWVLKCSSTFFKLDWERHRLWILAAGTVRAATTLFSFY